MNRGQRQAVQKGQVGQDEVRRLIRRWLSMPLAPRSASRSIPTSTARSIRSSSTADQLRKLVSGELYVGWLAVVMFQL